MLQPAGTRERWCWGAVSKVPIEIDLSVIVACKNNHIILQKAAAYTTAGWQSNSTRRNKMDQLPDYWWLLSDNNRQLYVMSVNECLPSCSLISNSPCKYYEEPLHWLFVWQNEELWEETGIRWGISLEKLSFWKLKTSLLLFPYCNLNESSATNKKVPQ